MENINQVKFKIEKWINMVIKRKLELNIDTLSSKHEFILWNIKIHLQNATSK